MNEPQKQLSREEIYKSVWESPLSTLALTWNTTIAGIIKACDQMNIPRPDPGHWVRVRRGWEMERPALPPAESNTPLKAVFVPGKKRVASKPAGGDEPTENKKKPKVEIPKDVRNAHRLVKQTKKALAAGNVDHHGFVYQRMQFDKPHLDQPLRVMVSPEQLDRTLRILDAIIKGIVDRGGRFEQGPEAWRLRLFVGKQPVAFHMREAMKRHDKPFTVEEREAPGFRYRDRYDWHGTGSLRFRIDSGEYVIEQTWEDSKGSKLEDQVGEIIETLARIEQTAKDLRAAAEERKKQEAIVRAQEHEEWEREEAEANNKKRLEQKAEAWAKARRLRGFIWACEVVLRDGEKTLPADGWQLQWLNWARTHADRIDPLKHGYLESEKRRISGVAPLDEDFDDEDMNGTESDEV